MAQHQNSCAICAQIEQCEAGTHPRLIGETSTGWAVMGESQYFRGYSLLLCKQPATELDELSPATRRAYLDEMSALAAAVKQVVQPHKLNYECLGNQVHHLHWHVFPRRLDEPDPLQPVWTCMPAAEEAAPHVFNPENDDALLHNLREAMRPFLIGVDDKNR